MNAVTRHVERIHISKGLEELGDHYDLLAGLYEKLQLASIEAADPSVDPLKFADSTCDFSLIIKRVHEEEFKIKRATAPGEKPRETRTSSDLRSCEILGLVYLAYSDTQFQPYNTSELNMGIVLSLEHRHKGYAQRAIRVMLKRAFKLHSCHRVKAAIMDPFSDRMFPAYKTFVSAGFKQEGIRRRAHYNPFDSVWQDVAYLAILDTEWTIGGQEIVRTTWGEMLNRHEREREEVEEAMGKKRAGSAAGEIRKGMYDADDW